MHGKKFLNILFVFIVLMAGCTIASEPTAKPVLIPTLTPYPDIPSLSSPVSVPEAIKEQITDLYQSLFGVTVPSPIISRYDVNITNENRWVSAAYIGNRLYEIDLFDDGHVESDGAYVNAPDPQGYSSHCAPKGIYRILVVIVDYHNTGFTYEQVRQSLMEGVTHLNQRYADYSSSIGLASPIFSMNVESVYINQPVRPGDFVRFSDIQNLTGIDPSTYDLVGQVDLDKDLSVAGGSGAGGFAMDGCSGSVNPRVNIWDGVTDEFSLQWLAPTLLDHELAHIMGWQHWWPRWDGSEEYNLGQNDVVWPALLFGWVDSDSDGIIEINDPTPYGTIR